MSPAPISGNVIVHAAQPIFGSSFCQFQLQLTSAVANVPGISRIAPWWARATLPLQTIADLTALAGTVIRGSVRCCCDREAADATAGTTAAQSPRTAARRAIRRVIFLSLLDSSLP